MKDRLTCPHCGGVVETYRNPFPTVDIIIEFPQGRGKKSDQEGACDIVLIKRKNPLAFDHEKILKDYLERCCLKS